MIEVKDISLSIASKVILSRINLAINPGTITVLLGPNGAGKSSLLNVISGIGKSYQGEVELDGLAINEWKSQALAKKRIFLSQKIDITMPYTVEEVVLMGRYPYNKGYHSKSDREIVKDVLMRVDLAHYTERSYLSLSGGEQQRVQIARCLAQLGQPNEGKYLLMDEPTNNLDIKHQYTLMNIINQIAGENAAVLMVLHDINLALEFAEQVLWMKEGSIIAQGKPHEVTTEKLLLDLYKIPFKIVEVEEGHIKVFPAPHQPKTVQISNNSTYDSYNKQA